MATQSSTAESKTDNVKHMIGSMPEKQRALAAKAMMTLNEGAKFMWRTWLGTAVTVEQQLAKAASEMAKKGELYEGKALTEVGKQKDKALSSAAKLRKQAKEKLDSVEGMFDRGVDRSLHFIGVPTKNDMSQLTMMIQDMSESINDLAGKTASKAKSASAKPTS